MNHLVQTFLGVLVLFLVLHESKAEQPYSWGDNVCSRSGYRTTYQVVTYWKTAYKRWYSKCGLWGWGRCKRTRTYRIYWTQIDPASTSYTSYFCCSGWRKSGRYCDIPICTRGCVNGRCSSPDTCSCYSGWYGSRCQYDRNECSSYNGGCQQICTNVPGSYRCACRHGYVTTSSTSCRDIDECQRSNKLCQCGPNIEDCGAKCSNTPGSYICSCGPGYKLIRKKICVDLNECSTGSHSCAHECINTMGNYTCLCRRGFQSKQDGKICEDIDECQTSNGGCQHICQNTLGSMHCLCREGFSLNSDGRTCSDIDECEDDSPCAFNCTNTIGSFRCSCEKGFKLDDNGRTCADVNECSESYLSDDKTLNISLSNCEQICINTNGSFACGCKLGFKLHENGISCIDLDECTLETHQCSHMCKNTHGSYQCSCAIGYGLEADGKTCKALPCRTLVQQPNGRMFCTGMATNDNCSFTCDHGYNMEGPSNITCMTTSRWSDSQAVCKAKSCGKIYPPNGGSLTLPCYTTYKSSCQMQCTYGYYYPTGNNTVICDLTKDKSKVAWKNNFQCHRVQTCEPNPCRHGGTCVPLTSKDFQCDCSSTGYEGRLCERGIIEMPLFPKLKANLKSSSLSFQAKPAKEIHISIQSDNNVIAQPKVVKVMSSNTKAEFTLTSKQSGLKVISYSVQGENAKDFRNPADCVLFVGPETPYKKSVFAKVPILPGELAVGCNVRQINLTKCRTKSLSSQPWRERVDYKASTEGIVHLVTKRGLNVPLSLLGIEFPYSAASLIQNTRHFDQTPHGRHDFIIHGNKCYNTTIEMMQFLQIVDNGAFTASFLDAFSKNGPGWLKFKTKDTSNYFDLKNIHAIVGSESQVCSSILNSPSVVYFSPSIGNIVTVGNEEISLPNEKGSCYAVDVCTSEMTWVLSKGSRKAIKACSIMKNLKQAGWDIELKEVMFPGDNNKTSTVGSEWNDDEYGEQKEYKMLLNGRLKAKFNNSANDVKISLEYEGNVFINTENISDIIKFGFDRQVKSILKGKAALNITMTISNMPFNIQFPLDDVTGKSTIGGHPGMQALFFRWKIYQDPLFASMIQTSRGKPVDVIIDVQAQGGKEEEMINMTEIKKNITAISSLLPQLKILIDNFEIKFRVGRETTRRYKTIVSEVESLIKNVQNSIKDNRSPALTHLISDLHTKVEKVRYICKVLMSAINDGVSTINTASVISQINEIESNLPGMAYVQTRRFAASQTFRGFAIKIEGKMCVGRICFEYMNISLRKGEERMPKDESNAFAIRGLATRHLKLGKVLSLPKGGQVIFNVHGNGHKPNHVFFKPTVEILGMKKVVSAEIIGNTLSFNASGLILGEQVSINVTAKTDVAEWSSLIFKVNGRLNKNTNIIKELQAKINSRILDLAAKAKERIKKAEINAEKAKHKVDALKKDIKGRKNTLNELRKQKRRAFIALRLAETKYWNYTTTNGKSKSRKITKDTKKGSSISRRSVKDEYPCQITDTCPKVRMKGEDCSFQKGKRRQIKITVKKCSGYNEKVINIERYKKVKKRSYRYERTYTTRLVSSCKNPLRFSKEWAVAGGALTAGALGLLTLNPIGLLAVAVSALLWGAIGGLVNFFMGCTYHTITVRGPDKKIPFMKITVEKFIEKKTVFVPDCYYTDVMVPSEGYDPPSYKCSPSIVHVPDPTCLESNEQCARSLSSGLTINLEWHKMYFKHELSKEMEAARMLFKKIILKLFKLHSLIAKVTALLLFYIIEVDMSVSAVSTLKQLKMIKMGLAIAEDLDELGFFKMPYISNAAFEFYTTGSDMNNEWQNTLVVGSKKANTRKLATFVGDFRDRNPYFKQTSSLLDDVLADDLLRKGRSIRSVSMDLPNGNKHANSRELHILPMEEEQLFTNNRTFGNTSSLQTPSKEDLCLFAKQGNNFFRDIVTHLQRGIAEQEKVHNSDNVGEEQNSLYQKIKNLKDTSKNKSTARANVTDRMLDAYLDLITSLNASKPGPSLLTWDDILDSWKSFVEILAKENSFSYCAGALDCVVETVDKLQEMYFYEGDLERAREIRSLLPNISDGITYLMTQNFTSGDAKERIRDIHYLLNLTNDKIILCGRKPEFTSNLDQNQVVLEGDSFELECNASSDTPLRYTWIHNGRAIHESVINGVLKITNATFTQEGFYKCKATNRKGFVMSNVTIITINNKPKIEEQPNDTQVYTKDASTPLLLTCNATGEPEPDIEWFFVSQYPNSSTVRVNNDNGSFLYYEQPTKNDSGYYFCVASNIHGRVESKKAQVWVLDMSPGEPNLVATINVTKTCKAKKKSSNCGRFVQLESKDEADKDLSLIKDALGGSMNTSESQISKVHYQSNKERNATVVFLYRSEKPVEGRGSNDTDIDPVVQEYARKRQQLFSGLQKLYKDVKGGFFNASGETEVIEADPDTLSVLDVDPGCPTGQTPHSNGYMCENCPPGTHGNVDGQCIPCPIKTYQYEQGEAECLPCDNGFITKTEGALSADECIDMRPSPPRNLRATVVSSTILKLRWLEPIKNRKSMWYYFIKYGQLRARRSRTERVHKTVTTWTLTRLQKFTDYRIVLYPVNSYGMTMSEIIVKTGEDVPDAAPGKIKCSPVSYNSMKVTWSPIPIHQRNGIIRGYHIYYKDVEEKTWNVYTTPTGNLSSTIVTGLRSYTEYCVKISGFTSKGEYPGWKRQHCKNIRTPSRPVNVSGRALSPREILLKFQKPRRSSESYTFVIHYGRQQNRLDITTACYSSSCVIRNLKEDTLYFFKVLQNIVQAGEAGAMIQIRTKRRDS